MDQCNPEANINNLRSRLRTNLGVPKKYAKNFNKGRICNAFTQCKKSTVVPPMKIVKYSEHVYMIDRKSPLTARDFSHLLENGKKPDYIRIAKKLKLVVNKDMTKTLLKTNIVDVLEKKNICEPLKLFKYVSKKNKNFSNVNNNLENFSNTNINGNFSTNNNISTNNLGNFSTNNNLSTNNLGNIGTNNSSMNLGNNTFNLQNESESGFSPGAPKIRAPNVRQNMNNNGVLNNFSNFVKTPKPSLTNNSKNSKKNFKGLFKELDSIKNSLGVFKNYTSPTYNMTKTAAPVSVPVATVVSTAATPAVDTVTNSNHSKNHLSKLPVTTLRNMYKRMGGQSRVQLQKSDLVNRVSSLMKKPGLASVRE